MPDAKATFRIGYFDASLCDHTGHQPNACRHIAGELRRRGYPVDVYASIRLDAGLGAELGASPVFQLRPYEQSEAFSRIDSYMHMLSFGHDLRSAWPRGRYPFVYFNSVLAPQFAAIGKWLAAFPGGETPLAAIEFGAPSGASSRGWFAPFAAQYRKASRYFRALPPGRVLLFTFDQAASAEYAQLLGLPVATLPAVHRAARPSRPRARRADGRITIGFLGQQREEKGVGLLADIVRGLRASGCAERILIHDGEPSERPVLRRLREIAERDPLTEFIHRPADSSLWQELLGRTDLVVLPYEPGRYRASYSAVAVEAVTAGIPMVVPTATTMHALAAEYQGGAATFEAWHADAVCKAIASAAASFESRAERAFSGAAAWEAHNGAERFADRLLEFATNPAAPVPALGQPALQVSWLETGAMQVLVTLRAWGWRIVSLLVRPFRHAP